MRVRLLVAATAMLVCAGCSAEPETAITPKPSSTTSVAGTTSPTPTRTPTTAARFTVPQYQRAMTNVEKVLKPYVARVMNARTVPAVDATRAQLAAAVRLQRQVLAKVLPPRTFDSAHRRVLEELDEYPDRERTFLAQAGETKTSCGVTKPAAVRLYQARDGIRDAVESMADDIDKAVGKNVKFGALVVPPELTPPRTLNARGTNGQVLQRSGPRGPGRLVIVNNSSSDVVIVVTNSNPRKPQASIYVREDGNATLYGIRGSYYVYFKSGTGWDAANRRFTEDCSYERYDDRFDGRSDWRISLARTPLGNAPTSEVGAF